MSLTEWWIVNDQSIPDPLLCVVHAQKQFRTIQSNLTTLGAGLELLLPGGHVAGTLRAFVHETKAAVVQHPKLHFLIGLIVLFIQRGLEP